MLLVTVSWYKCSRGVNLVGHIKKTVTLGDYIIMETGEQGHITEPVKIGPIMETVKLIT